MTMMIIVGASAVAFVRALQCQGPPREILTSEALAATFGGEQALFAHHHHHHESK
jgi:ABC-type Mn2+/Zn2+ transport system ATPase subunit